MNQVKEEIAFLIEKKKIDLAIDKINESLSNNHEDDELYFLYAQCYESQEKFSKSIIEIDKAISFNPEYWYYHYYKWYIYNWLSNYKKALVSLEEALRLEPDNANYYALLWSIYLWKRDIKKARIALNNWFLISPNSLLLRELQSTIEWADWNIEKSIAYTKESLAIDSQDPYSLFQMWQMLLYKWDYKWAKEHFLQILSQNPKFPWAKDMLLQSLKNHIFIYRIIFNLILKFQKFQDKAIYIFVAMWIFLIPFRIFLAVVIYLYYSLYHWFNFALLFHPLWKMALSLLQKVVSILFLITTMTLSILYFFVWFELDMIILLLLWSILLLSGPIEYKNNKIFWIYFIVLWTYLSISPFL